MSYSILSPADVALRLADRVRARRLARAWTQAELAERSGVALPTFKLFERTGQISLERLLRIAAALGALEEFGALFPLQAARSLDEIEAQAAGNRRRYGRRRTPPRDREGRDAP